MNSDVRDILEINDRNSPKQSKKKAKRLIESVKRPQGVHREVWGLISTDDPGQPPLIPAEEPKLYKHPKAKLRYGVRKWHWVGFKNPARTDSATFYHWRCVNDDPEKEYPFAKYNKKIQFQTYNETEYNQYLKDENWSKEETDYLFDLCQTYDLKFFVIHDRWDSSLFQDKKRTIDELKDRYYKVTGLLQKLRGVDESKIYVFDLEHEQKRREQLEKLFNRTKEQVEEEVYLVEELKKIEVRKKEREKKHQEVSKLLTAASDLDNTRTLNNLLKVKQLENKTNSINNPVNKAQKIKQRKNSVNSNDGSTSAASANKPLSTKPSTLPSQSENLVSPSSVSSSVAESKSIKKPVVFKTIAESAGIKFPDTKLSGVSLRSFKTKLPQSVGLKKIKAIEQLLDELQIEHKPIATESVCDKFNELRSEIVLLYELQQALTGCEYELQALKHRYEPVLTAKNIDMSLFDIPESNSALLNSLTSANTPQKRISEIFDVSITPGTGPLERRRKAALNQTNLMKRLRGRNAS
ncbi:unnamed protein product [Brachionus calyciflorus]|uniref:DNA methyltransferase 1-associated protein 1 n=1 Tax=Brachionus calyciflorus TaxID=104777 RepID=A0A813MA16_9BILA|nr:unnamed protein product [Brachionus calyciflorus]